MMNDSYSDIELCKSAVIHRETVARVRDQFPEKAFFRDCAEFFKVFGDATRMKILYALLLSEMCVCDLTALLDMTQSAISHQLRILKQAGLVRFRKDGRVVYYSPTDDHIRQLFEQRFAHMTRNRAEG
jgi:ArsR family transcriptional regulator